MNDMSIQELETELRSETVEVLDPGTLAAIRREGGRRRARTRTLTVLGSAAVVAVAGLAIGWGGSGTDDHSRDPSVAVAEQPRVLSPLAHRALAEIPGTVQVSEWQVVLPTPAAPSQYFHDDPAEEVVGEPIDLGARTYQGVTMYPKRAWPEWLYLGVASWEQTQGDDETGYPVGSTDNGILVDAGAAYLACVSWEGAPCGPSLMTRTADGQLHRNWGMGTDDFLKPGSDMEVFLTEDYSTGAPATLAFAGLPGTDVARVELVTTTGAVVAGHVTTTLVEGASMMWGTVPGELAKVVAYDAEGVVIEDHPLEPCDTPVECEVR